MILSATILTSVFSRCFSKRLHDANSEPISTPTLPSHVVKANVFTTNIRSTRNSSSSMTACWPDRARSRSWLDICILHLLMLGRMLKVQKAKGLPGPIPSFCVLKPSANRNRFGVLFDLKGCPPFPISEARAISRSCHGNPDPGVWSVWDGEGGDIWLGSFYIGWSHQNSVTWRQQGSHSY